MQDQFEELMRESEEGREDIDEDSFFEDEVNNLEAKNPVDVDMEDLVSERIALSRPRLSGRHRLRPQAVQKPSALRG